MMAFLTPSKRVLQKPSLPQTLGVKGGGIAASKLTVGYFPSRTEQVDHLFLLDALMTAKNRRSEQLTAPTSNLIGRVENARKLHKWIRVVPDPCRRQAVSLTHSTRITAKNWRSEQSTAPTGTLRGRVENARKRHE